MNYFTLPETRYALSRDVNIPYQVLGDGPVDSQYQLAKQTIDRHRGILVKNTGDGILATFDGPGRAVRCALAFSTASRRIGFPLLPGLHTGEIERRGAGTGGLAV